MAQLIKSHRIPTYKVSLQEFSNQEPTKVLEMEASMISRTIKLKIGTEEITMDAKRLLKAVHLLCND